MPYKTFQNWLFDGSLKTNIPVPRTSDDGKVIVPDILRYNSPITNTYVINIFMRNGHLNYYLNKHFNNINLRYLTREELFKFIKKCVIDFRIKKRDIIFLKYNYRNKLFNELRRRLPTLKIDDIELLCDIIDRSPEKASIYSSLNIETIKKQKTKKNKQKKEIDNGPISLEKFLDDNFAIMDTE